MFSVLLELVFFIYLLSFLSPFQPVHLTGHLLNPLASSLCCPIYTAGLAKLERMTGVHHSTSRWQRYLALERDTTRVVLFRPHHGILAPTQIKTQSPRVQQPTIGFQQATMSKPVSRAGSELRAMKRRQSAAVEEVVGGEEKKGTAGEKPVEVVVVAAVVPAVEVVVEVVSVELGLV